MDQEVLERTMLLLGSDVPMELASFAAGLAEEQILGYCNLEALPAELVNTAAGMAVELYRRGGYGAAALEPQAKSVTRMDATFTFMTPAEQMQQAAAAPGFFADYAARLAPYRRMRW